MVSKASEDLPEPDRPVNTTSRSRGISRSTFLRLCSRAPRTAMTRGSRAFLVGSLAGRFLSKRSFIGKWLPFPRPSAAGFERGFRSNVVRTQGFCQGGAGGYSRNTLLGFWPESEPANDKGRHLAGPRCPLQRGWYTLLGDDCATSSPIEAVVQTDGDQLRGRFDRDRQHDWHKGRRHQVGKIVGSGAETQIIVFEPGRQIFRHTELDAGAGRVASTADSERLQGED